MTDKGSKFNLWRMIKSHLRRLPLEILNLLINYDWVFWLIGLANRLLPFVESVFLVYPANEKYALAYVYKHRLPRVRWWPWLCGLLWQNRRLTLMFCISATEELIGNPVNLQNLVMVNERMEKLRQLMRARRKTYAGILPGVLYAKKIIREAPEADLTAQAVTQAITEIKTRESLPPNTPILVLGGQGFIGRRVMGRLGRDMTYSVDISDGPGQKNLFYFFPGQRIIVVNIAKKNALKEYLEVIPQNAVILNEVYPEPDRKIIAELTEKKCSCYHLAGIRAKALPPFPAAYAGAIPCCAAWPAPELKIVVRKLN